MPALTRTMKTTNGEEDFEGERSRRSRRAGSTFAALEEFIRFMGLDPFLVQAAAQASPPLPPRRRRPLTDAIPRLPRAECDAFLRRLLDGRGESPG